MDNLLLPLWNRAQSAPRAVAIFGQEKEINYEDLEGLVQKACHALFGLGVRVGSIYAVRINDELLRVVCFLGLLRMGVAALSLPRSATTRQAASMLELSGCCAIIGDGPLSGIDAFPGLEVSWALFKNASCKGLWLADVDPESVAIVVSGSGSSGYPKLMPISFGQLHERCSRAFSKSVPNPPRVWSLSNIEFFSGLNRLIATIQVGGAFSAAQISQSMAKSFSEQKKVSTIFSSVFHAELLVRALPAERGGFRSLSEFRISGSAVDLPLRKRVRDKICDNVSVVYGANECGRISKASGDSVFSNPCFVGEALPGVKLRIVKEDGSDAVVGDRGEIVITSLSTIKGYINDEVSSAKSFRNGEFFSGDVGELDSEGRLLHYGRRDDMFIMNGINIFPAEIEVAAKSVPGVRDVAIIVARRSVSQEVPVCFACFEACAGLTKNAFMGQLRGILGFKCPVTCFIVDRIPRNGNGKVLKSELVKMMTGIL